MAEEHTSKITVLPPPESLSTPVTIDLRGTSVKMYVVSEERLDMLGAGYSSVHLAFASLTFGVWVAVAITLSTIDLTTQPNKYAAYWLAFWSSLVATVYFGVRAFGDIRRSRKQVKAIKDAAPTIGGTGKS